MGPVHAIAGADPTGGTGLHDDLHWLLARLKLALATAEVPAVRKSGLSLWGYTVLAALSDAPAPNQLALAQTVAVDKSKLVQILDELERARLVVRRPDPLDRRARIIEATEDGLRALREARAQVAQIEDRLLEDLDPRDRADLLRILGTLAGAPVLRVEEGLEAEGACPPAGPETEG
jgi:DNA-binding MarR family transcriptional regulator